MNEPTLEKLKTLRLVALADAWKAQQRDPSSGSLPFDERLGLLVDAEWMARENNRMARHLRAAKLRNPGASIENVETGPERGLERALLRQLATCRWVAEHHNVLITGATGTGKTWLACALAQQACRKGHRALYRRSSRLFDELRLARADGSYARLLASLARVDVLVLDDLGLQPIREGERADLLEILEDRHGQRSTVILSQVPVDQWHALLGDPTMADAICDRVVHRAHRVKLVGPSRRKTDGPTVLEAAE